MNMVTREELFARSEPLNAGKSGHLLLLLSLLVICFVVWANWATLDEQVRARGEAVVSSRSQVVQAVDGGVLVALHVREGQRVEAGELLAELDKTRFAASVAETQAKALGLRANIERLQAELGNHKLEFSDEVAADPQLVKSQAELHRKRLRQQREERESLQQSLKLARQELNSLETLSETGDAAISELIRARRDVVDLQAELNNRFNEYRRESQERLTNAQTELEQTMQVLKQRQEALDATEITAPMTGVVKNIEVTTLGAVLKSGDEVLQIVPSDEPLLIEVRVNSRDVAFIRPGLEANVKLDAYDFTVYGSLRGKVTYVSADTIDEDLKQDEEPYYKVLAEITRIPDPRPGKEAIEVIPGMTATVEIITGHRTVMQYLLKPLIRGSDEAFTER